MVEHGRRGGQLLAAGGGLKAAGRTTEAPRPSWAWHKFMCRRGGQLLAAGAGGVRVEGRIHPRTVRWGKGGLWHPCRLLA